LQKKALNLSKYISLLLICQLLNIKLKPNMKKSILFLAVASVFALASCSKSETAATEATAVIDSAAAVVDSAVAVVDSAAAVVDSAAATK
jgi:uncharacterized lipoprotein YajG